MIGITKHPPTPRLRRGRRINTNRHESQKRIRRTTDCADFSRLNPKGHRGLDRIHRINKIDSETFCSFCPKNFVTSVFSVVNGADGISDIEGEAATGSGERGGSQASFKSVVACRPPISVHCCSFSPQDESVRRRTWLSCCLTLIYTH